MDQAQKDHIASVNSFIPEAVHQAMLECANPDPAGRTGRNHADFDTVYLRKMNELTIAARLRVSVERLMQINQKLLMKGDGNGK